MWKAKKIGGWETGEGVAVWTDQKVYLVSWWNSNHCDLGYRIEDDKGQVERVSVDEYEGEWETVPWATPLGLPETKCFNEMDHGSWHVKEGAPAI